MDEPMNRAADKARIRKLEEVEAHLIGQLNAAVDDLTAMRAILTGEYWIWQEDGGNHPESLSCPVLMRPERVRAFVTLEARLKAGVKAVEKAEKAIAGRWGPEVKADLYRIRRALTIPAGECPDCRHSCGPGCPCIDIGGCDCCVSAADKELERQREADAAALSDKITLETERGGVMASRRPHKPETGGSIPSPAISDRGGGAMTPNASGALSRALKVVERLGVCEHGTAMREACAPCLTEYPDGLRRLVHYPSAEYRFSTTASGRIRLPPPIPPDAQIHAVFASDLRRCEDPECDPTERHYHMSPTEGDDAGGAGGVPLVSAHIAFTDRWLACRGGGGCPTPEYMLVRHYHPEEETEKLPDYVYSGRAYSRPIGRGTMIYPPSRVATAIGVPAPGIPLEEFLPEGNYQIHLTAVKEEKHATEKGPEEAEGEKDDAA